MNVELPVQTLHMTVDGVVAELETGRDLLFAVALQQAGQDLLHPKRQPGFCAVSLRQRQLPAQKAGSFNLEKVMSTLEYGSSGGT